MIWSDSRIDLHSIQRFDHVPHANQVGYPPSRDKAICFKPWAFKMFKHGQTVKPMFFLKMNHNQGPLWYERANRTAVVFGWRNRVGMDYPSVAGIDSHRPRLEIVPPWPMVGFPRCKERWNRLVAAKLGLKQDVEVSLSMPGTRAVSQWYFGVTLGLYLSVFLFLSRHGVSTMCMGDSVHRW